ncbi:F-box/LRR-repeat protein 4 [Anopheles aquasalis]|uniref:F-box/LRR-repeat protein 4 n=1 Tax=Anopheles aquasalis TaxID=42839 RepID=UPI00215A6DE2|nr:F-box/LRR-repeat protein 4 [Anopheles aquasalis]XP_050097476.1 F-box/LRR-repeat protein 4 [Anopheles aquasalis]
MNNGPPRSWVPTYAMSANSDLFVKVATFHQNKIDQYVTCVMQASDQYASTGSITYAAFNLVGRPTHFPNMGDFADTYLTSRYGNWWLQLPSAGEEFGLQNVPDNLKPSDSYILCCFDDNVYPLELEACETLSAGAIQKVWMRTTMNTETRHTRWALLWDRAVDPLENIDSTNAAIRNPFTIKLRQLHEPGQTLMIELNHRDLDYHAGLDSIMLKGGTDPPVYIPCPLNLSRQQEDQHQIISQNNSSTRIDQLPEELLFGIFQYLDLMSLARVARVCTRFQQTAQDSCLYFEINLRPYWMMTSPQLYNWVSKRAKLCRKLNVSWNTDSDRQLAMELLSLLRACCNTLTHLRMSYNAAVTEDLLQVVFQNCPKLQELSIDGRCSEDRYPFVIGPGVLTNLVRLNLADSGWLDTSMLLQIVSQSPNLKHLNINFCNSLALPELFELLGNNNHQLISLNAVKAGTLTSEALCCLAGCTQLQELDVGWTFQELNWQTEHLRTLLIACPMIKKLFMSAARDLQDNDLFSIAGACSMLEQLSLVGCNNISARGIQQVLEHCKNLKLLDISHCEGIEHESVLAWQNTYGTEIKRIQPTHNIDG